MKELSLINEYRNAYVGSKLEKTVNLLELPIKYTINGVVCYFYNPNLFGLFEMKVSKNGLTPDDFAIDYKNGFLDGSKHLRKNEKIKLKDFRSNDLKEGTILQVKYILHEMEFVPNHKGLLKVVFDLVPLTFTDKKIYYYGYCNAIAYSIDEICKKAGITKNDFEILKPQQTNNENETVRITTKHYVLAYVIECNATGKSLPIGQKKELERIGNKRIGKGKGNYFYKVFHQVIKKDLNVEKNLIEIGGEDWRTIVKNISNEPEAIESYLQSKQL